MQAVCNRVWNERWRLAALDAADLMRIGLFALMCGVAYIMFHHQGNTLDVSNYGRSVFSWGISRASRMEGDFSHGWLIPLVSLYVVWLRRKDLIKAPKQVSWLGFGVVAAAMMAHWMGARSQFPRVSILGFILLLWGIPFFFWGWQVARILIFPCAYLLFSVPMNFLDTITFPLRMIAAVVSTAVLNGLGIAAQRSGSAIYSVAAGGFSFDVADPCSGLRSLLAMTALTAVYAYLTQKTLIKKWLLFLSSIPLAMLGNIARIATVGLVAEALGQKLAVGLYHDYSGYVVFSVAIGSMVALGSMLNTNYREVFARWKKNLSNPMSPSSA